LQFRKLLKLILISSILTFINGCYLIKQGIYLISYNSRARPIKAILEDPDTEEKIRSFLELAQEIRAFAIDSVGLVKNGNYSRMVKVDNDYIAVFVSAAQKLSFDQYKWCFPILGCIPYKGFFELEDAKKEAGKLSRKGYDVDISKVDAFSTLGFFSDPLYSYMADYNAFSLASLMIHEQTHATIYLKGQARFNEELATYIGNRGALEFIKSKYGEDSDEYRNAVSTARDRQTYSSIMKKLVKDLEQIYQSNEPPESKLEKKQQMIDTFRLNIKNNYDNIFKTPKYHNLGSMKINNASLAIWMTYTYDVELFELLYREMGGNLRNMVDYISTLKKLRGDPKAHIREFLQKNQAFMCTTDDNS